MRPERPQIPPAARRGKAKPPPPRTFLTDKTLFAEVLRRLRARQSDSQCASRAGVSLQTWRRWERGKERPGDEQIARILGALDATAESFDAEVVSIILERLEERQRAPFELAEDLGSLDEPERLLATLKLTAQTLCNSIRSLESMIDTFHYDGETHDQLVHDAR